MKSQHPFRFAVAPEFTTAADWTETCAGSYIMKVRQGGGESAVLTAAVTASGR